MQIPMKAIALSVLGAASLLSVSCETADQGAVNGAVVGGGVGALAGGIIGHQSHNTGAGAIIGGAAGAATGSVIGAQQGQINEDRNNADAPPQ